METDKLTHLYTLHVKPDNTFEIFIDQESVRSGNLEDSWDFLPAKEIKDPSVSKVTLFPKHIFTINIVFTAS